jgi:hypothetical protein
VQPGGSLRPLSDLGDFAFKTIQTGAYGEISQADKKQVV